jgi:hypothetical protein
MSIANHMDDDAGSTLYAIDDSLSDARAPRSNRHHRGQVAADPVSDTLEGFHTIVRGRMRFDFTRRDAVLSRTTSVVRTSTNRIEALRACVLAHRFRQAHRQMLVAHHILPSERTGAHGVGVTVGAGTDMADELAVRTHELVADKVSNAIERAFELTAAGQGHVIDVHCEVLSIRGRDDARGLVEFHVARRRVETDTLALKATGPRMIGECRSIRSICTHHIYNEWNTSETDQRGREESYCRGDTRSDRWVQFRNVGRISALWCPVRGY